MTKTPAAKRRSNFKNIFFGPKIFLKKNKNKKDKNRKSKNSFLKIKIKIFFKKRSRILFLKFYWTFTS